MDVFIAQVFGQVFDVTAEITEKQYQFIDFSFTFPAPTSAWGRKCRLASKNIWLFLSPNAKSNIDWSNEPFFRLFAVLRRTLRHIEQNACHISAHSVYLSTACSCRMFYNRNATQDAFTCFPSSRHRSRIVCLSALRAEICAVAWIRAALRVAVSVDCVIPVVQPAHFLAVWFPPLVLQSGKTNKQRITINLYVRAVWWSRSYATKT